MISPGRAVGDVTALTVDSQPLREDEAKALSAALPNIATLTIIGWVAAEEPRAPVRLQNIAHFAGTQRLVLDRVKFHERFLKLLAKELPNIAAVTIVCYRDEGSYQHLGARPNTFLHQLQEAVPAVTFEAEEDASEFTIR